MNHEASYVVGRVLRDAMKMKKKQNEGEANERVKQCRMFNRFQSHQWDCGDECGALFSRLRHKRNITLRSILLAAPAPLPLKPQSSPAFCVALFLIPLRSSSHAIALSRENSPSFRAVSLSLSLSVSRARALSFPHTLFSEAKGRDPERRLVNMIPESDTRKPLIIQAGTNGTRTARPAKWKIFTGLSVTG